MKNIQLNTLKECATCKHKLAYKSKESNAITCDFCNSIFWFNPEENPWKKNAGIPKELLSVIRIGSKLNINQQEYEILGLTEWHLTYDIKLFWTMKDVAGKLSWLIEQKGQFYYLKHVVQYHEQLPPFKTVYLERELPGDYLKKSYLVLSNETSKRYEVFGEVYFPFSTDPQIKHIEAYDTAGNLAYMFYQEKKKRFVWEGIPINLLKSKLTPKRINIIE